MKRGRPPTPPPLRYCAICGAECLMAEELLCDTHYAEMMGNAVKQTGTLQYTGRRSFTDVARGIVDAVDKLAEVNGR